jgi:hypothetical protein
VNVHVLMADFAQVAGDGKLNAIGAGWTTTHTPLPPHAVIIWIDLSQAEIAERHQVEATLLDVTGQPVVAPGAESDQPYRVMAQFDAVARSGVTTGATVPVIFNIGPGLPLGPGSYEWHVTVDGEHLDGWSREFVVGPNPDSAEAAKPES